MKIDRDVLVAPLLLLLVVSAPAIRPAAADTPDACLSCHLSLDREEDPADRLFANVEQDVHLKIGLGCAGCHGGDPTAMDDDEAAMSPDRGFRGVPSRREIPEFCGRCHADVGFMRRYRPEVQTDQLAQYWTSRHGRLLKQGQEKAATCIDCHGVHGILPVDDPQAKVYPLNVPATCGRCHADPDYMAEFGIPTDQLDKYKQSVHGVALLERKDTGAPTCNDCHGNHGATPPAVANIAHVCGQCHVNNENLFRQSHLSQVFEARDLGYCIGCHGKHAIRKPDDRMLDWNGEAVCLRCHRREEVQPHEMAASLKAILDTLRTDVAAAESLVGEAENRGMEVSDLLFKVEDARKGLITTRTSIHSFDPAYVAKQAAEGRQAARAAVAGAHDLLRQWSFRRKGLLAASLFTTLLIVALYLKLRQMERTGRDD